MDRAAEHAVLDAFLRRFSGHRLNTKFKTNLSVVNVLGIPRFNKLVLLLEELE